MPVPGIVGVVAAAAASGIAAVAGRTAAPINRTLTAAADAHEIPTDVRALQRAWDRGIVPRALLQGLAVAALGVSRLS